MGKDPHPGTPQIKGLPSLPDGEGLTPLFLLLLLHLRQEIGQALLQVGGFGLVLHLFQLLIRQVEAGFVEQVGAGEIDRHDGRQAVDLQLVRAGLLTARGF